jgi:hypothetical protein
MPSEIAALAFVADPFRTELKRLAPIASLHHQFVAAQGFPKARVHPVALRLRRGQSLGQIVERLFSHPKFYSVLPIACGDWATPLNRAG